jgi:hypothetical protein
MTYSAAERPALRALLAAVEIGTAEGTGEPLANCDAPPAGCEKTSIEQSDRGWSDNRRERQRCARFASESHPAYGLRQQRRVHALLGGLRTT